MKILVHTPLGLEKRSNENKTHCDICGKKLYITKDKKDAYCDSAASAHTN